jgi:hypothetical protein
MCQAQKPSPSKKEKKINQIQNRNKSNKTNQALRYIPLKAETNLPCVGSRFTSCGREFLALQLKTTND